MGAESFQFVACLKPECSFEHACSLAQSLAFVDALPERQVIGGLRCSIFIQECDDYFMELECRQKECNAVRYSLRYALCQSRKADEHAARILWTIAPFVDRFQSPDVDEGESLSFSAVEQLIAIISVWAARKRAFWHGDFGHDEHKTLCVNAYDFLSS